MRSDPKPFHSSMMKIAWNAFKREHPSPSQRDVLDYVKLVDRAFNKLYWPKSGRGCHGRNRLSLGPDPG